MTEYAPARRTSPGLKTQGLRFPDHRRAVGVCVDSRLLKHAALRAARATRPPAKTTKASRAAGTIAAASIDRRWTFQAPPSWARLRGRHGALCADLPRRGSGIYHVVLHAMRHGTTAGVPPSDFVIAQGTAAAINFIVQRTVGLPAPPAVRRRLSGRYPRRDGLLPKKRLHRLGRTAPTVARQCSPPPDAGRDHIGPS